MDTVSKTYKGKTYVSVLLRRSFREAGKVKHETLGNLSDLPVDVIEFIRRRLAGELAEGAPSGSFEIVRSLPHGNVAAVLQTAYHLGLDQLLASRPCRQRDLCLALIAARLISPGSKLSACAALREETAQSTLWEELGLGDVQLQELYAAMDWLLERQSRIENKLAKKHLQGGMLVLFDVSSSYYTGRKSTLVQHGYSRDHRGDQPQIVYGLLCDAAGRPLAIEVLPGNTADPRAFQRVVERVRKRFGIQRLVFVGDRGMITSARIREDLRDVKGLDWITALRSDGIRKLAQADLLPRSLFDERDLAEIVCDDFPGERLIVCRNPLLAEERARKRETLLQATEAKLEPIRQATLRRSNPLRGKDRIALRVGKVIGQHKMAKHFELTIADDRLEFVWRTEQIAAEALLDGLYVIRTSVPEEMLNADQVVGTYKSLSHVERAFRSLKTVDLQVRPIYHHHDDRIRAHVFLCMLAYYVEWHMRERLRTVLFDDCDRPSAEAQRPSPVAPAQRSSAAHHKEASRRTEDGRPVQSFQDLLKDLATLTRSRIRIAEFGAEYDKLASPTEHQRHVLQLLNVTL
ncbi:MAG: IS1634 family transposase [Pirellulaceae bacterium]|nr:IS1634 family transposase [Pirellulaceae bacterium]